MSGASAPLLVLAVALVGVLHTIVPDHWAPLAIVARQKGWSTRQTARAAALAGTGHTLSTLVIAIVVWLAGVGLGMRFGYVVTTLSSIGLIVFGGWIALSSLREMRDEHRHHGHSHHGHAHVHRHADGLEHRHWHDHHDDDRHSIEGDLAALPIHEHGHDTSFRVFLLLILGSSPMIEGIPAFFAASRYGVGLLVLMAVVFALSTVTTYVVLSVASVRGGQRMTFGPLERYGEVLSGGFIALLGIVFLAFPKL